MDLHYTLLLTQIQTHTIASGFTSFTIDGLFNGIRPDLLVVGITTNSAFVGRKDLNPYYFNPWGLVEIGLFVDEVCIGGRPMKILSDNVGRQTMAPFINMYATTGRLGEDSGLYLERSDFENVRLSRSSPVGKF